MQKLELKPFEFKGDYINGEFVKAKSPNGEWQIVSPANLKDKIVQVSFQNSHVDEACKAARQAYKGWASLSLEKRKEYLLKLKAVFAAGVDRMAELISRETGKPLWETKPEAAGLAN
ncbi:MAG: aldehyde dehydrogenase family protein, partial [Bdellovibrionota bacterium]